MIHVLVPGEAGARGRRIVLAESESRHLRVRRARDGEVVALRDGSGLVGTGRLLRSGGQWQVEIEAVERQPAPPELTLAVGSGDRDRFAWLIEKAVELGATTVVPLETERAAGVASRLKSTHLEKLRRVAMEAVKQSGAAWTCTVTEPLPLADLANRPRKGDGWLADPDGEPPPAGLNAQPVTVVIGPEGGLTPDERRALREADYRPVTLGRHTLRFETAAIAAAAMVAAARLRGTHG